MGIERHCKRCIHWVASSGMERKEIDELDGTELAVRVMSKCEFGWNPYRLKAWLKDWWECDDRGHDPFNAWARDCLCFEVIPSLGRGRPRKNK